MSTFHFFFLPCSSLSHIILDHIPTEGVIKHQWVDESQDYQEFFRLLYSEAHGAKNVTRLVDHQLVRFKIGDVVEDDATSVIRELVSARLDDL